MSSGFGADAIGGTGVAFECDEGVVLYNFMDVLPTLPVCPKKALMR